MKKTILLIILLISFSCVKKRRDNPYTENYWLGKWTIEQLFETDGSVRNTFNEVKGFIKFNKRLKVDMYGSGKFKLSYKAPNATLLSHENISYEGSFKWRNQSSNLIITMDEDGAKVFGIGREGMGPISFNYKKMKEDYIEISTPALPPGFQGLSHGFILTR